MGTVTDEAEVVMSTTISVQPVNSILFLSDESGGEPPVPVRGPMVLSTPTCVSFRCYPEQDGPTELVVGMLDDIGAPDSRPAFEGDLETPNRIAVVSTADWETVVQANVRNVRTHVRIWLSHPEWPKKVVIGLE
jgi:hypothetical protein